MINSSNGVKSKFTPKHPEKYVGDISKITSRSSWEKFVMMWADSNPDVIKWGSEITVIEYICGTDGDVHKYYIDFTFKFSSGKVLLVEVKPKKQTHAPERTKGKSKKTLLTEDLAYIKNKSKWKYAIAYAKKNNINFEIWSEETLKKLGFNKI